MIAQLSHLRPKEGRLDAVIQFIKDWGVEARNDGEKPFFSFVSVSGDHLFAVAFYEDEEDYKKAIGANEARQKGLMDLLDDNHGPTYYGPVLMATGEIMGVDLDHAASGIYIPAKL